MPAKRLDEPLMWGVLPFRHLLAPDTMRWSLGSHDICFKTGCDPALARTGDVSR
jgi:monolysocardiolipin acyltransferase